MMINKLLKYIMLIKILWDEQMKYEFLKMNGITVYMHRHGHIPFWKYEPLVDFPCSSLDICIHMHRTIQI